MSSPLSDGSRSRSRSPTPSKPRQRVHSKRVVIANIPYDVTWNKLKQLFREKVGFTGFLRLMKTNGRPNGMGVMEFKTIEGAEKAIELMHRFEIGDRKIIVREETLRDHERMAQMESDNPSLNNNSTSQNFGPGLEKNINGGPSFMSSIASFTPIMLERFGIKGPITDSLYISNLDYKVDWKKIKDIFKLAGHVAHATIKKDEQGRSRGIAVVRFEHPYEALLALNIFNGQVVNERPIRVKMDREGTQAPPNLPIFPPTADGAAAANGLLSHLIKAGNCPPLNNSSGNFMNSGPSSFNQQGMMPHQSDVAATVAAFLAGNGNPGGSLNNNASYNNQFRLNAPSFAPHQSTDLLNSILGQQSNLSPTQNIPQLLANQRSNNIAGAVANLNPLNQLLAGLGNQPGFNLNQSERSSGGRRDNANVLGSLQQLLMAAAAGGMSHDQIVNAASTFGFSRDDLSLSALGDGGNNFNDRYGDRGSKLLLDGRGAQSGNSRISDYDGQQPQQPISGQGGLSDSMHGSGIRDFSQMLPRENNNGPSNRLNGGRQSRNMLGQRGDSTRGYSKRLGDYAD